MKKTERIEIRLTNAEKKIIKQRAEKAGLNISEYARQNLLNNRTIILTDEEKRNITGIGRNFNQLMRFSNARNYISPAIEEEIKKIITELKKYYY